MAVIYKYNLKNERLQQIAMPNQPIMLNVQIQNDVLQLWAIVDPDRQQAFKTILMIGTGQQFGYNFPNNRCKSDKPDWIFISTVQLPNGLVYHFFHL